MKKILLSISAVIMLAAACNSKQPTTQQNVQSQTTNQTRQNTANPAPQNQQATSTEMTKQDYVISDSKKAGWKTYTNTAYNFTFDFPADFNFHEDAVYQLPDENGKTVDVLTLKLDKGDNVGLSLNMNRPGAGCGEIAKRISTKTLRVNEIDITKNINTRSDANQRCLEYFGFKQGDNGIYMLGWMPLNNTSYEKTFDAIVSSFRFVSVTLQTYKNDQYGFEFQYPSNWSLSPINTGSGYDPSKPFLLIWAGTTSDAPCQDLGCPPKSGDRDELTKGNTYEGGYNPWYKILRVRGSKWVSIQLTDVSKKCSTDPECQQYVKPIPFEQKMKLTGSEYQNYNAFLDLLSTFTFTKYDK